VLLWLIAGLVIALWLLRWISTAILLLAFSCLLLVAVGRIIANLATHRRI
jgi:hypothetical protein